MFGQGWDDDPRAVSETAAPHPDWWIDNINSEFLSSDVQIDHEFQITPVSVPYGISEVYEDGTDSTSADSQPADNLVSGESQTPFHFNDTFEFEVIEQQYSQLPSDHTYCMTDQSPISSSQWDSSSFRSSSILSHSDEESAADSRHSIPHGFEDSCLESLQNGKNMIMVSPSIKCSHCLELFYDKQRLE